MSAFAYATLTLANMYSQLQIANYPQVLFPQGASKPVNLLFLRLIYLLKLLYSLPQTEDFMIHRQFKGASPGIWHTDLLLQGTIHFPPYTWIFVKKPSG